MRWVATLGFSFSQDSDVAFRGDVAYVAMNKIQIVDIADPESPQHVGEISAGYANPRRVATSGDLLVATLHGDGIEIYSTSDPEDPQLLVRYSTPTAALDVELVGTLGYVGSSDGILVLDLSAPAAPVPLGTAGAGEHRRVAHQDGYLYATMDVPGGRGFVVYDLVDPTIPVESARWGTDVMDAVPNGGRLYVALAPNGFAIFDLTDRSSPLWLGTEETDGLPFSINGFGDYVFPIYLGGERVDCFAATGSPPWPLVGTIDTIFGPEVLKFHGGYAYAPGAEAMDVFDLSAPESQVEPLGWHENLVDDAMRAVIARNGYAYVNNRTNVVGETLVQVIDVSDPTGPHLVRSLSYLDAEPLDFALGEGPRLYVAALTGVKVIDITDPPTAMRLGSLDTPGSALQVTRTGTHLLIADGNAGLQVAALEPDPDSPVLVGSLGFPTGAVAVAASGDLALVLLDDGTLNAVDIAVPESPFLLGSMGGFGFGENVAVQGNLAFVDGSDEVHIVDLSSPTTPVLLASVAVPGMAHDLIARGEALYVTAGTAGLQVFDIQDPAEPALVGDLYLEHISHGIEIHDDVIYVASESRLNLAPLDCRSVTGVPEDDPNVRTGLFFQVMPNPFRSQARIRFSLAEATRVDLVAFDAAGRRVRTLISGERGAGSHLLPWDGRDDDGRSLPAGVYLLQLRGDSARFTEKILIRH